MQVADLNKFKIGDYIVGTGNYIGISEIYLDDYENVQPFSYLGTRSESNFRLATEEEIRKVTNVSS